MKFRWGYEKIKGYSEPIKEAEWINDWSWWALLVAVIIMEVIVILKILEKI